MDLFDEYGAYNYRSFKGNSGVWKHVGTQTNYSNVILPFESNLSREILICLDTFKLENGKFKEIERFKVMAEYEKGLITPVEESIINIPFVDPKDYKKKSGRAV